MIGCIINLSGYNRLMVIPLSILRPVIVIFL